MINKDPYLGKEYGIYEIIGITEKRSKDGHIIYRGRCKKCGHIREARISSFKNRKPQNCKHKIPSTSKELKLWYEQNKKQCLYCGKYILLKDKNFSQYKKRKFCNNSCAASYNNIIYNKNKFLTQNDVTSTKNISQKCCLNCKKELKKPTQKKYCSTKCMHEYEYKEKINKWKKGEKTGTIKAGAASWVIKYIKEKYNNQCCKCGWKEINPATGKVPVEVHHKDGNYKNNEEKNLELLCPNCHSLTTTYKALNCGIGRKDRYK